MTPARVTAGLVTVGDCDFCDGFRTGIEGLREPEVQHLHGAVDADLDVGGLQIAMDDPVLVRGAKRLGDLLRDRQCLIDWNRALCNSVGERRPLDQFHDKRLHSVCLLQAIDMGDVRMIEGGEDLRFSPETSEAVRVRRERIRQHLQGDRRA